MTLTDLKAYKSQLTPDAYRIAECLVDGMKVAEICTLLKMGQLRVYSFISAAEGVIGQRLRQPKGSKRGDGPRFQREARRLSSRKGKRCAVCFLLEPHTCMDPHTHMYRVWEGSLQLKGVKGF